MESQTSVKAVHPQDLSFAVDPGEIDTFVDGVRSLENRLATYIQNFEDLRLDKDVFGRLPGISSKVYKAYDNHVDEGVKAFDEGKSVLKAAGDRGGESAASYRQAEKDNIAKIRAVEAMIEPVAKAQPAIRRTQEV